MIAVKTAPKPPTAPRRYVCAGCGYGICLTHRDGLPRCPVCRVQSWRPERLYDRAVCL